ncbi:MAG: hypothetical protein AABZ61_06295, partial [Bacteroidota bacterium]
MKELSTTIFTNFVRVLGVMALLAFATVSTAFADNISKTFAFGVGTENPRSSVTTFSIPCGTPGGVIAVVKFQRLAFGRRLGRDDPSNDTPIIIELREPDTAPGREGPLVVAKTATAKATEQTITLPRRESNRGCTLPWRVRVRYADEGTAPFRIYGSIRLNYWDGRVRDVDVSGEGSFRLNKGEATRINLDGSGGLPQGIIQITGIWHHALFTGPNPVKLKFELIDPNGTVVRT